MSIKSILLHLHDDAGAEGATNLAVAMAHKHGARLIGLALAIKPQVMSSVDHPLVIEAMEAQEKATLARSRALADGFCETLRREDLQGEARIETCTIQECPDRMKLHGRYSDLLVMTQSDPDHLGLDGSSLIQDMVLDVGRPILIAPYVGSGAKLGGRVVVAWNASHEATRAVIDALPILEQAEEVVVLVVEPGKTFGAHGGEPGADIARYLAQHGCKVRVQVVAKSNVGAGDEILNSVSDLGAGLLVMGAYGHSRLREFVLGGATRTMLDSMTVPVLMAH